MCYNPGMSNQPQTQPAMDREPPRGGCGAVAVAFDDIPELAARIARLTAAEAKQLAALLNQPNVPPQDRLATSDS
jgi:hypothetical protein